MPPTRCQGATAKVEAPRRYTQGDLLSHGHRLRSDDVTAELLAQDPNNVRRRQPGPDDYWTVDGHDKLVRWGFEIHSAIDAYRYVIWIYVGTVNRA